MTEKFMWFYHTNFKQKDIIKRKYKEQIKSMLTNNTVEVY